METFNRGEFNYRGSQHIKAYFESSAILIFQICYFKIFNLKDEIFGVIIGLLWDAAMLEPVG